MPGHLLLLATIGSGRAVGFVFGVLMRHPDKDPEMFLFELGVDDAYRRRVIAVASIRALARQAVDLGGAGMWTGTERGNAAALAVYTSLGATVDTESVFIEWNDLAEAFAPDVAPRTSS